MASQLTIQPLPSRKELLSRWLSASISAGAADIVSGPLYDQPAISDPSHCNRMPSSIRPKGRSRSAKPCGFLRCSLRSIYLISMLSELPPAETEGRFWPDTIRDISGDGYRPAGAVDRLCPSGATRPRLRTKVPQTLRIPKQSTD